MESQKLPIRATQSVCPVCLKEIKAVVIERNEKVFFEKHCMAHGDFRLLLSNHPDYYKNLSDFYFPLMDKSCPQRDYIVHLTNRCNLNCPICLASANLYGTQELPIPDLEKFLKHKKNYKIDLMGAEPTLCKDLVEIIKTVKKSGNIAALHTNGVKLADFNYLCQLKKAGLREIHLQFDGFSDSVYEKIRGVKLLANKLRVLENLEKLNIATDLVTTIVRGVNEEEMIRVLQYGIKHSFVKEVFFLGCRFLGKAKQAGLENCYMPDELIDLLEQQTGCRINREDIFKFQKLYFSLLSAFSVRKCFYIHHFLVSREKGSYQPISQIFNLKTLERRLDRYKKFQLDKKPFARWYLLYALSKTFLKFKYIRRTLELLSFGQPFIAGFDLTRLSRRWVLLGFISACDRYSLDYEIAKNCGKGALSVALGREDMGAVDNVKRDCLNNYENSCTGQ